MRDITQRTSISLLHVTQIAQYQAQRRSERDITGHNVFISVPTPTFIEIIHYSSVITLKTGPKSLVVL
jgi:hypothetical protein